MLYAASQTTVLHMKRLSETESPIFVDLCVLYFQRQPFFTFSFLGQAVFRDCRISWVSSLTFLQAYQVTLNFSLLALRLPRLGRRESYYLCFSYVCSICACLVLSVSSSSWCLGRAAVCDCGTPWTFLLTPFLYPPLNLS